MPKSGVAIAQPTRRGRGTAVLGCVGAVVLVGLVGAVVWIVRSWPEPRPAPDEVVVAFPAGFHVVSDRQLCGQDTDDHCERHLIVRGQTTGVNALDRVARSYCSIASMTRSDLGRTADTPGGVQWWGHWRVSGRSGEINVLRAHDLRDAEVILITNVGEAATSVSNTGRDDCVN